MLRHWLAQRIAGRAGEPGLRLCGEDHRVTAKNQSGEDIAATVQEG